MLLNWGWYCLSLVGGLVCVCLWVLSLFCFGSFGVLCLIYSFLCLGCVVGVWSVPFLCLLGFFCVLPFAVGWGGLGVFLLLCLEFLCWGCVGAALLGGFLFGVWFVLVGGQHFVFVFCLFLGCCY